jgi:hypothetical protein
MAGSGSQQVAAELHHHYIRSKHFKATLHLVIPGRGERASPVLQICESPDGINRVLEQVQQYRNNRYSFALTEISEGYTGLQHTIVPEVHCYFGGVQFRMRPFISFENGLHRYGEQSGSSADAKEQLFMFIDNVEVMDHPHRMV